MALIQQVISVRDVAPLAVPDTGAAHIRRCTFRRVTAVPRRRELPIYDVACLYPGREAPIPLGDMSSARPICDSCTAVGTFRPDAD